MKQILLVEDDRWLADSYRRVLEKAGYAVQTARDGHEAIRLIDTVSPDAIVADVLLEGQTILALLHELQGYDDTGRIPVVICSALTHPQLRLDELHHYGVRAVLDKTTLAPGQLTATLAEVLA